MTTPDPGEYENDETLPIPPGPIDPADPELPPDPAFEPAEPVGPADPIGDEPIDHDRPDEIVEAEQLTQPAPGGPNDPGASASDDNQADTAGYAGGGENDPPDDPAETTLWDEDSDQV